MSRRISRLRSHLNDSVKKAEILGRLKALVTENKHHLVIGIGSARINALDCTNFTFDPALGADNLNFTRPTGPIVKALKAVADLTYTAVTAGSAGNAITVAYTTGATAGAEVVTVVGSAISVQLQSGVSTATQVKAAVDAAAAAAALVTVAITGTAGTAQVTTATTNLANGADIEHYDNADITFIKRLRNKKWLIRLSTQSDARAA